MRALPPPQREASPQSRSNIVHTQSMYRNGRAITINGGQHLQVNGDYNYHVHPHFASDDDAAVRKREGKRPLLIP